MSEGKDRHEAGEQSLGRDPERLHPAAQMREAGEAAGKFCPRLGEFFKAGKSRPLAVSDGFLPGKERAQ